MTLAGQRTFDELGAHLMDVPFCVLDLETTGLSPDGDAITEIGAVRYSMGLETGRFQSLINPDAPIPPRITVVTGITQAMVIDAPKIGEALPSLLEFIGDAVIVGHNVRFDMSFLNAASIRLRTIAEPFRRHTPTCTEVDSQGCAEFQTLEPCRVLRFPCDAESQGTRRHARNCARVLGTSRARWIDWCDASR